MLESALKYCKEKTIDLLAGFVPKTYSMAQECNILGLYDDTFIITKTRKFSRHYILTRTKLF
ncbi:hypothetical protein VN0033_13770 [Helicobacter pylori]